MKATQHLTFHGFLLFVLFTIILFGDFNLPLEKINRNILVFSFGILLYFLGAILPDSDSNNKKSYIFRTVFFPIAYLVNLIEYPLLILTKRKRGHRESLHTILGILLSSVIVTLFFSLLYFWISKNDIPIKYVFFWFLCLLVGQFLHLVEDKISNVNWKIKFI